MDPNSKNEAKEVLGTLEAGINGNSTETVGKWRAATLMIIREKGFKETVGELLDNKRGGSGTILERMWMDNRRHGEREGFKDAVLEAIEGYFTDEEWMAINVDDFDQDAGGMKHVIQQAVTQMPATRHAEEPKRAVVGRWTMLNEDDIARHKREQGLMKQIFGSGIINVLLSMFDYTAEDEKDLLKAYILSAHALGRDLNNYTNVVLWRKHLFMIIPDQWRIARTCIILYHNR